MNFEDRSTNRLTINDETKRQLLFRSLFLKLFTMCSTAENIRLSKYHHHHADIKIQSTQFGYGQFTQKAGLFYAVKNTTYDSKSLLNAILRKFTQNKVLFYIREYNENVMFNSIFYSLSL